MPLNSRPQWLSFYGYCSHPRTRSRTRTSRSTTRPPTRCRSPPRRTTPMSIEVNRIIPFDRRIFSIVFPDGSKNFLLFLFISYIVTTNDKLINNDEYFFARFMFHFSFFFFRFKRFDFAQKKLQTTFSPSLELEADCFR